MNKNNVVVSSTSTPPTPPSPAPLPPPILPIVMDTKVVEIEEEEEDLATSFLGSPPVDLDFLNDIDEASLEAEFLGVMDSLYGQAKEMRFEHLLTKSNHGQLSAEEKQELKQLSQRSP